MPKTKALIETLYAELATCHARAAALELQLAGRQLDGAQTNTGTQPGADQSPNSGLRLTGIIKMTTLGDLVPVITHDMLNLISPIVWYADLIGSENCDAEKCALYVKSILEAAEKTVLTLQNLAEIGANRKHRKSGVDLAVQLNLALSLLESGLTSKNIVQVLQIERDLPLLNADAGEFAQVLFILLLNAARSMRPVGGKLIISAQLENHTVKVSVTDHGPLMAPELIAQIFNPFHANAEEMNGIRLYACRQLIEANEGTLEAAPGREGGTCFTFSLPIFKA